MSKYKKYLRKAFDRLFYRDSKDLERIGPLCSWVVMPALIPKGGTIISGGVGQDIGFEKELSARFNCSIYLFDPSPTGKKTMSLPENTSPGIFYYELGLAGHPGAFDFSYPRDPEEGSFRISDNGAHEGIEFRCESVSNFMKSMKIDKCDLLKLDIEGFEYGVIDELLFHGILIPQICVEYHHFIPGIPVWKSLCQIWKLLRANYYIAYKSQTEYLFVLKHSSRV